jgi:hypothetical protein
LRQILAGALQKLRVALRAPLAKEQSAERPPSHATLMDLLRTRLGLAA